MENLKIRIRTERGRKEQLLVVLEQPGTEQRPSMSENREPPAWCSPPATMTVTEMLSPSTLANPCQLHSSPLLQASKHSNVNNSSRPQQRKIDVLLLDRTAILLISRNKMDPFHSKMQYMKLNNLRYRVST